MNTNNFGNLPCHKRLCESKGSVSCSIDDISSSTQESKYSEDFLPAMKVGGGKGAYLEKKKGFDDDEKYYERLRFRSRSIEYLTEITFEDEMDWMECEAYYTAMSDGMVGFRSSYHSKKINKVRHPSKTQLEQEANGQRPSCLRKSKYNTARTSSIETSRQKSQPPPPPLRRSLSFNTLPRNYSNNLYTHFLGKTILQENSSEGPRVNFDDYVSYVIVPSRNEYTQDVKKNLWMSTEEANRCQLSAMIDLMNSNSSSSSSGDDELLFSSMTTSNNNSFSLLAS